MQCPYCGGNAIEIEETYSAVGTWHWTLCCGIGWHLVANYELLKKLPPEMMEAALATDRLNRAKRAAKIRANSIAFMESVAAFKRDYPHLVKGGEQETIPIDFAALAARVS